MLATSSENNILQIKDFKNLINKKVREVENFNKVIDKDDLSQELTIKIYLNLPRLQKDERSYAFKQAKIMLDNVIKDFQRYYARRLDTSYTAKSIDEVSNDEEVQTGKGLKQCEIDITTMGNILSHTEQTAFDFCSYRQLKKLIIKWTLSKDKKTRQFIKEGIFPSKDFLKLSVKNTPTSRAKHLNISGDRRGKITRDLAIYLANHGFKNDIMSLFPEFNNWNENKGNC